MASRLGSPDPEKYDPMSLKPLLALVATSTIALLLTLTLGGGRHSGDSSSQGGARNSARSETRSQPALRAPQLPQAIGYAPLTQRSEVEEGEEGALSASPTNPVETTLRQHIARYVKTEPLDVEAIPLYGSFRELEEQLRPLAGARGVTVGALIPELDYWRSEYELRAAAHLEFYNSEVSSLVELVNGGVDHSSPPGVDADLLHWIQASSGQDSLSIPVNSHTAPGTLATYQALKEHGELIVTTLKDRGAYGVVEE